MLAACLLVSQGAVFGDSLGVLARAVLGIGGAIIWFYVWIISMYVADCMLRDQEPPAIEYFFKKIDLMVFFENAWLWLRASLTAIPFFILFIIPGFIYLVNRCLSPYVLNLRGTTVADALRESKRLMTAEAWYSTQGPQMRIAGILIAFFILSLGLLFLEFLLLGGLTMSSSLLGVKDIVSIIQSAPANAFLSATHTYFRVWLTIYQAVVMVSFYRDLELRYPAQGSENASPR